MNLLSMPMGVDNLRICHFMKAIDWSSAIFCGLLNIITKYELSQKKLGLCLAHNIDKAFFFFFCESSYLKV